jgi:carboxyl-terminal processing protease
MNQFKSETTRSIWQRTREIQIAVIIVAVFVGGFLLGSQYTISQAQGITLPEDAQPAFEPFFQAYNLIQEQFINDPEIETLVDGAISGMVDSLGDQYSAYINPELNALGTGLEGEFEGIGAYINFIEETGEVEILNLIPGSPAEAAGLQSGDVFVEVEGQEVIGMNTSEIAAIVRGPAGTFVNLTMRRDDELIEVQVERARIEIIDVVFEMLENNIGHLTIVRFSANVRQQIDEVLADVDPSELNGLIIDLRGNGGGFLRTGLEVSALLIDNGVLMVERFGTGEETIFKAQDGAVLQILDDGTERVYIDSAPPLGFDVPVVLLVDEFSASASEIVAGGWQTTGVATLVGTTTFGKGTVQIQNTLVNDGGLKLTIAQFLTPDRGQINEVGITPEIIVEIPEDVELAEGEDPQLEAAVAYLLGVSVTVGE